MNYDACHTFISLFFIKYVNILILQWFRFFVEFLMLEFIRLSYSSNNVIISMTICAEFIIFSQFWLLHEMLHNLGVQLIAPLCFFFFRLLSIMNFNFS
jgi:hypothetical protein